MIINIEIKDRNRPRDFLLRLYNRLEDIAFSIIQKLPERFVTPALMNRLSQYLDNRISELKHESIKLTWQNMHLQDALENIKNSDK